MAFLRLKQSGFSLIEVIVAFGLSSLVVVGSTSLLVSTVSIKNRVEGMECMNGLRTRYVTVLGLDAAWEATINNVQNRATAFSCFPSLASCPVGFPNSAFKVVYSDTNADTHDFTDPKNGFTSKCEPCDTYDTGANGCVIQLQLTYSVVVGPSALFTGSPVAYAYSPALDGQIMVFGRFVTNSQEIRSTYNLSNYGFQISRYAR